MGMIYPPKMNRRSTLIHTDLKNLCASALIGGPNQVENLASEPY